MRRLYLGLSLAICLSGPSLADPVTLARTVVDSFVVPRVEALAAAADTQARAWDVACTGSASAALPTLKAAFQATADAWNAVGIIRHGPVAEGFRIDRLYMWPERKTATTKAVAALIAKDGTEDLSEVAFAQASAAAQGLPALERVLYDETAAAAFADPATAPRRCALGQAISRHTARLASEVVEGWTGPSGRLAALKAGNEAAAIDALTRLATDLMTAYQTHVDQRLSPVLGTGPDAARPALAEFRRSGRALRALRIEIAATDALLVALTGESPAAAEARRLSARMRAAVEAITVDLPDAAGSATNRVAYIEARTRIRDAQDATAKALPAALGITLGFNSLDGD